MVRPNARRHPLWLGTVAAALLAYVALPLLPAVADVCHELHHAFEHITAHDHGPLHEHHEAVGERPDPIGRFSHTHDDDGKEHGHSDLVDLLLTVLATPGDELTDRDHAVGTDIVLNCHLPAAQGSSVPAAMLLAPRGAATVLYPPDTPFPPPDPPPKA